MNKNNSSRSHPLHILVVEDSPTQAHRLARLLENEGYLVRIAPDGRAALAAARDIRPDLVISDISMPVMDGFALCKAMREDAVLRTVPIILLTSLTSLYDVIKGLECGADNFLRKPFDDKYLLERIDFIISNRETRRDQLGMRISLGGTTHFVNAERQQILDMLLSTYEEAIRMTEELRVQQERLERSYQTMESLYRVTESLNPAVTLEAVTEAALEASLDFPDVVAVRVSLSDAKGRGLEVRTRGLPASSVDLPDAEWVRVELNPGKNSSGAIELLCNGGTDACEEHRQVLRALGNQVEVAMERAALYANMQSLVQERTMALEDERNLLSAVLANSGALVMLVNQDGLIEMFNPACEQCFGWRFEEVRNRPYWDILVGPECTAQFELRRAEAREAASPLQSLDEFQTRDGRKRHIIWSATLLRRPDGDYFVCTGMDLTERREAEERVRFLSNFDVTTGFANRRLLEERFSMARSRAQEAGMVLGVFVIHFPRLTELKQTLGTEAEMRLLLQIAGRLRDWAGNTQNLARLDETSFGLLMPERSPAEMASVANDLVGLFRRPFNLEHTELQLSPWIGITVCPHDGEDFDQLSTNAATAMRNQMAGKAGQFGFYEAELNRAAITRIQLESEMRGALERDEFVLHFQPQFNARSGRLVGLEALLRWNHPRLGLLGPAGFIGLAEETGLILPIGEWVLRAACRQNSQWQKEGLPVVPIHVNLSARQFMSDIAHTVQHALDESQLAANLLAVELTESASMEDPERTMATLLRLKQMGVGLAIDDFGTGYSNLAYLKQFPVDRLKLDRSFVGTGDLSIAHAVIDMAHRLQLKVIAEGVETQDQLDHLRNYGCDEVQGYFTGKPASALAWLGFLQQNQTVEEEPVRTRYLPRN